MYRAEALRSVPEIQRLDTMSRNAPPQKQHGGGGGDGAAAAPQLDAGETGVHRVCTVYVGGFWGSHHNPFPKPIENVALSAK